MSYCCPCPEPGYLAEPYHLPGYAGHVPTYRDRIGGSYGKLSNLIISDPCVAQAPCPILQAPMCPCHANPGPGCFGCSEYGVCIGHCCPPAPSPPRREPQWSLGHPCNPCCDPRGHHLNRGPYVCPW